MKKLIYCALALAAGLFATSCQQENLEPVQSGTTVTYTVEMPQVATKAVGEADYVNNLVYAVYRVIDNTNLSDKEAKENLATNSGNYQLMYQEDTPVTTVDGKKKAHISLELINDQRYVVIFWAQKDYTWFNEGQPFTSVAYPTTLDGNNDAYDAFTNVDVITVDRPISKDITLVRPFAQLNIATVVPGPTTEYPDRYTDFQVATTGVVVTGVAQSFNVGAQVGETVGEVTFSAVAPLQEDFTNSQYPEYLSMNYVFVPANQSNVTVSYDINTNNYGTVENTVPNVPLARNYRTNIIGNLLTSEVDYNVELAPWHENSNSGTTEVIVDGLVKNQKGDYEISTDNGLIHAINNLWVDEHGVANSATFYVYPQEYNITDDQIRDIHVTSGTLKVIKDVPVMTRSIVFDGIVIKGLSKPLIATVGEEATVVISGVTIQNYEGDGQQGALIGENDGKVIIEDCAIVDENGDDDQTTELIGDANDKPGTVTEPSYEIEGDSAVVYDAVQLAAAFAADEVEAIVLGANIALEDVLVFPEGRTATLDLKGFELTIAGEDKVSTTYAINNHGTLTIKDSYGIGAVNARGIYNGYVANGDAIPTAKLIIEGGNFNAKGTNGGAAVFNYGQLEINGGKFTSVASYSVSTQAGGKVTVNGGEILGGMYNSGCEVIIINGKIEGDRSGCHTVYNYNANVTINGGTFHNNNSGNSTIMAAGTTTIKYNGGTYSIKDGRVEGNGNTWTSCLIDSQNTATSEITAGTFNGGFRVQAGTSMTITGGSFNDCFGSNYNIYGSVSITGGTYTDANAKAFATKYAHKDYKLVNETVVPKVYTVQIGAEKYETLQEAVDVVENEGTITLIENVSVTETSDPNGNVVYYTGDKSFTIDLNGKELKGNTSNVIFRFQKSEGAENTITIKNGTVEALQNSWSAISIGSSASTKTYVNLVDLTVKSQKANDMAVRARSGAEFTMTNCTVVATESAGGICAGGGNVTLNNVTVNQTGWYSNNWNSVALGLSGGAKMTINSGNYTSNPNGDAHGTWVAYVMSSGGTLEINGGTFNGTVAQTANSANACGLICADTKAVVKIYDGTFNSNGAILDMRNNTGGSPSPVATLYGGTFSADPTVSGLYGSNLISIAAEHKIIESNGYWSIIPIVYAAKIGETNYDTLYEAVKAAKAGDTITLTDDADLEFTDNPMYNNIYASVIDLNDKTLTIKDGDLRFANTTIKNGNIIVEPKNYPGTAVFVMYGENTLTIENTAITATGIYGTYLIGLEDATNLVLKESTITINNDSLLNLTSAVASNGSGTITIEDSDVTVKNINGRAFLGGNYTVKNSNITADYVKAGFYIRAGQSLSIDGSSTVTITNLVDGKVNGIDLYGNALYEVAEGATVNATVGRN